MKEKIVRIERYKENYYDDVSAGIDVIERNFEELERRLSWSGIAVTVNAIAMLTLIIRLVLS